VQDDVVVRVATSEVEEVDGPAPEVDPVGVVDQDRGRGDDHLGPFLHRLLAAGDPRGQHRPLVGLQVDGDAPVPVDGHGGETLVAEGVVEVGVGVHDCQHGLVAELAEVAADLVGLARRGTRVDQQEAAGAADHADAHVQRVVPALEHPLSHLSPARHHLTVEPARE
jgi:hypothetical protein